MLVLNSVKPPLETKLHEFWSCLNLEDKRPLKCELCGKVDFAYRFKESKRFCSMACAKRYNVNSVRKMALLHPKMPVKSARRKVTIEQNANKDVPVADDMTEV